MKELVILENFKALSLLITINGAKKEYQAAGGNYRGGFGGIHLAKKLKNAPVDVLMIDKHNYHTFQPLLYQVAGGSIAADSIGFPLRRIFTRQKNFRFALAEVQKINPETNTLDTDIGTIYYDYLAIATGSNTNFFGNKEIEHFAMPMKNIPEALNLRSLILQNLEMSLVSKDPEEKAALMTFVVVGGGQPAWSYLVHLPKCAS